MSITMADPWRGAGARVDNPGAVVNFVLILVIVWLPIVWLATVRLRQALLVQAHPLPPTVEGLHPYAVAMALGGPPAAVATAMVRLHRQGVLLLSDAGVRQPRTIVVTAIEPVRPNALDQLLILQLRADGRLPHDFAARVTAEQTDELVRAGVFLSRRSRRRCRVAAVLPGGLALGAAACRLLMPAGWVTGSVVGPVAGAISVAAALAGLLVAVTVLIGITEDPRAGAAVADHRHHLAQGRPDHSIRSHDDPDHAARLAAVFGPEALAGLDRDYAAWVFAEAYRATLS